MIKFLHQKSIITNKQKQTKNRHCISKPKVTIVYVLPNPHTKLTSTLVLTQRVEKTTLVACFHLSRLPSHLTPIVNYTYKTHITVLFVRLPMFQTIITHLVQSDAKEGKTLILYCSNLSYKQKTIQI